MSEQKTGARSDLEIASEVVLAEIPRGSREVLRVVRAEGTRDGTPLKWTSLRVWYRDRDGVLRPGKQGISLRAGELATIASALSLPTEA